MIKQCWRYVLSDHALEVESVSFNYGQTKALSEVSLSVPAGHFVALLGANGAGKTTLFSIVTGLYAARSGRVGISGFDMRSNTLNALAKMGVVFQRTTLDLDLTVMQNLTYACSLHGIKKSEARNRIAEGVGIHGLEGLERRKAGSLSGGQRRRVELCRALLHRPSLLLLDEPTVGLDLGSRSSFVAHVKSLCTTQQTGVLWATHLLDEISDDNDLYILDKGQIVSSGVVGELLHHTKVPDIAGLFHSVTATGVDHPNTAGNQINSSVQTS